MPSRKPPTPPRAGPGVTSFLGQRPTYVCPKCQRNFGWYKGVKVVRPGIALCEEHNKALSTEQPVQE